MQPRDWKCKVGQIDTGFKWHPTSECDGGALARTGFESLKRCSCRAKLCRQFIAQRTKHFYGVALGICLKLRRLAQDCDSRCDLAPCGQEGVAKNRGIRSNKVWMAAQL